MRLNPSKCTFGVSLGKFLGFIVSHRGIEVNPDKIQAILNMEPPWNIKKVQSLIERVAALNRFVSKAIDKCLPFFKVLKKAFEWTDECQKAFQNLKIYLTTAPLLSPSMLGEELYLYLAVTPHAVSSALIKEEGRMQKLASLLASIVLSLPLALCSYSTRAFALFLPPLSMLN